MVIKVKLKKLYFDYYPSLKEDKFLRKVIATNKENNTKRLVMLDKFEPFEILSEGHSLELVTYKGVMVFKQRADKDMFKINLLNMIKK